MASGCKYFYEDAVYKLDVGLIQYGVITENAEYASSEEDDDDKYCCHPTVKKGEVRVAWYPSGNEQIITENKLNLADRSLMPGDVVKKINNKVKPQCGYCTLTRIKADVEILGSNKVLCDIPSEDLVALRKFEDGVAVVLDSWIGLINKVHMEVTLKTSDGSRCVMDYEDAVDLVEINSKNDDFCSIFRHESVYPQQYFYGPAILFQSAKWISKGPNAASLKSKPNKSIHVTVEKIETKALDVQWQCQGFPSSTEINFEKIPPTKIEGKNLERVHALKLLDCCSLQIGDKKTCKLPEDCALMPKYEWLQMRSCELLNCKYEPILCADTNNSCANNDKCCDVPCNDPKDNDLIASETTSPCESDTDYEDVEDENEKRQFNSESFTSACINKSKSPSHKQKKKHGFFPKLLKKKKLKKAQEKSFGISPLTPSPGETYVVQVISTNTIIDVIWQDGTVELGIPASEVYPINHVDDHEYFPGDFVIDNNERMNVIQNVNEYGVIQNVDYLARTANVNWMSSQTSGSYDLIPKLIRSEEVSVYDLKDHPDFNYRPQTVVVRITDLQSNPKIICEDSSPGGQVVSLSSTGKIVVCWADGKQSSCYPQELNRIGDYDSDDSIFGDSYDDASDSNSSWETESEESVDSCDEAPEIPPKTRQLMKNTQELNKATKLLSKHIKLTLSNLEKGNIKQIFESYKKLCTIDSQMGFSNFNDVELNTLYKQLSEIIDSKKHNSKIMKLTELFGVSSENVKEFFQNLNKLKLSWEKDVEKKSTENDSSVNGESSSLKNNPKSESDPEINPCQSGSSKGVEKSKTDLFAKFIQKFCTVTLSLVNDFKKKAEEYSKLEGSSNFASDDEKLLDSVDNQCRELEKITRSVSTLSVNAVDSCEVSKVNTIESPVENDDKVNEGKKSLSASDDIVEELKPSAGFSIVESASEGHKFKNTEVQPSDPKAFFKAVKRDLSLMRSGVPDGIFIKTYSDRMDLFSFLIIGPTRTPYEDGLFLFDLQLPKNYPSTPPLCHYISFCSDRLNPNLYEDGKVCVSLLGTWGGKGTEVWIPDSNIRQLLISIQGLILVPEPYYNEPGTESQRNTPQGKENSRLYNEMAVLKLTQSMAKLLSNVPPTFLEEIKKHYENNVPKLVKRFEKWLHMSETWNSEHPQSATSPTVYREAHADVFPNTDDFYMPEYPLLPASRGFCLSMRKALAALKIAMDAKEW